MRWVKLFFFSVVFLLLDFQVALATTYVNSVQYVSITIASGSTSNTAAISTVGSDAFIIYLGETTNNNGSTSSFNSQLGRIELTNPTTVTAYRNTSAATTITLNAAIVDATSSLVNSVQCGTVSISASTTGTTTVTSVNTSNSAVQYLGATTSTSTTGASHLPAVTITNSTTVTANVASSSTDTVGFCLIEFQSAVMNQAVQQFASAFTSSSATDTQTITSVDPNNAFIMYGGGTGTLTSMVGMTYAAEITAATTVTLTRNSTTTSSRTPYYTVVEFIPGVLNSSVQRGLIDMASKTSNTATIGSINTSYTMLNCTGWQNSASNSIPGRFFNLYDLTNSTTVTISDFAGNSTGSAGYEVVEFVTGAPPATPSGDAIWFGEPF